MCHWKAKQKTDVCVCVRVGGGEGGRKRIRSLKMRPSSSSTSLKKTLRPKKVDRMGRLRPRSAASAPSKVTSGPRLVPTGFDNKMEVLEPDPVLQSISRNKLDDLHISERRSRSHSQSQSQSRSRVAAASSKTSFSSEIRSNSNSRKIIGSSSSTSTISVGSCSDLHTTETMTTPTLRDGDTFLTSVARQAVHAASASDTTKPEEGRGKGDQSQSLENRMTQVQATQNKLREELQSYLSELSSRTGVDGEALVDFQEKSDSRTESDADREKNWRKFISENVRKHPDEKEERKQREKVKKGLVRIAELDSKLDEAERKYLESQRRLKELEIEIGEALEQKSCDEEDLEISSRGRKTKSPPPQGPVSPSASRLEKLNDRAVEVGRAVLLTSEEEERVAQILGDVFDDASTSRTDGKPAWEEHVFVGATDADAIRNTEIDGRLKMFTEIESDVPRTRKLVFNEKRSAFVLMDAVGPELLGTTAKVDSSSAEKVSCSKRRKKKRESKISKQRGKNDDAGEDILASMRQDRIAKVKEKQIDDALAALKEAPLERVIPHSDTYARRPQSIRAVVQPVTRGDIIRVLSMAKDELSSLGERDEFTEEAKDPKAAKQLSDSKMKLAPRENIQKLIDEIGPLDQLLAGSHDEDGSKRSSGRDTHRSSPESVDEDRVGDARLIRVKSGPNSVTESLDEEDSDDNCEAVSKVSVNLRQKRPQATSLSSVGEEKSSSSKKNRAKLFAWKASETKPDHRHGMRGRKASKPRRK